MLDEKGFDLWADEYDKSVGLSDEEDSYPFAGYKDILNRIYRTVLQKEHARVLDIGFGTGTLTSKLYERGCEVWGQDFSERMIELAREKMPEAHLFHGDFSEGLVQPLRQNRYDFIVATYSLHHLDDAQKVRFLTGLRELLAPGGAVLIGDVAFNTRAQLDACRAEAGDEWDEDEIYFVYDELRRELPALGFEKLSHCAGVLTLPRE